MNWRDFWNGDHAIYVSDRHRMLHYDGIAKDICALVSSPDAVVLDHGCGEASSAALVAARCAELYLYDQAPAVQEKLRLKFSRNARIKVLATSALDLLPDASLDLIVVNSLLQYLTHAEFEALLDFWHARLKPAGMLVLADILPLDLGVLTDARALLRFGWQGGFLFPAMGGLVQTAFSPYRQIRKDVGLTRYAEEDVQTLLSAHGFKGVRVARNLGHNQARMCVVAGRV